MNHFYVLVIFISSILTFIDGKSQDNLQLVFVNVVSDFICLIKFFSLLILVQSISMLVQILV